MLLHERRLLQLPVCAADASRFFVPPKGLCGNEVF